MIATDPLSLVFIFCFLLGFGFFLISALLGSLGHGHAGSHAHAGGHIHAGGHVHVGGHTHVGGHIHAGGHAHHVAGHTHTSAQASGHQAGNQHNAQGQNQHGGFSLLTYLNPTSIGFFLLGFGLFGYFFHNLTNVAVSLSILLAIGSGIVLAFLLLVLLNRAFAHAEGSTELDVVDRTGMLGKVSITIPEKGLGEIIYTSPGGVRKSIPARGFNGQSVTRDQEVVVVNYQNGVAEVDTWDHFMQEEVSVPYATTSNELAQLHALLDASSSVEMEMMMHQEKQKE